MIIPYRSKIYFVFRDFVDRLVATFYLCVGNLDRQSIYTINLGGVHPPWFLAILYLCFYMLFGKMLKRKQNLERKFSRELLNLLNVAQCIYTQ